MTDPARPVQDPVDVRPPHVTLGASLKQYLDIDASVAWAKALAATARTHPAILSGSVALFILPSLPALDRVISAVEGTRVAVGAQDLFWEDRGPYTGGVSGSDLAQLGCRYVEIGHAERRAVFGEDELVIRRKFAAAVRNTLTPVLCIGERRQSDVETAAAMCIDQLDSAMASTEGVVDLVVAYEPEWAIGQAEPAPSTHVVGVTRLIRGHLEARGLGRSPVIYGGSAKPGLLTSLKGGVDGLFLGRFAHDPAAFARIIDEAVEIR